LNSGDEAVNRQDNLSIHARILYSIFLI
jgi:hypothetical protein